MRNAENKTVGWRVWWRAPGTVSHRDFVLREDADAFEREVPAYIVGIEPLPADGRLPPVWKIKGSQLDWVAYLNKVANDDTLIPPAAAFALRRAAQQIAYLEQCILELANV